MRYTFISRETNHQRRTHIDKYIGQPMHLGRPAGNAVAFERQVPFRKGKKS